MKSSVGILGHPKVRVAVSLQAAGYIPFLARCVSPEADARERMKVVQVLRVCAQHTGTQITAPLSSGDVQAAGKRHARQYHAQGSVMRKVRSGREHFEPGQEGQAGRWLPHLPLVKLRGMLSQGRVGKGCGGEGVTFPDLRHAAQSFMLGREVVGADAGMTRDSARAVPGPEQGLVCAPSSGCMGSGLTKGALPSL